MSETAPTIPTPETVPADLTVDTPTDAVAPETVSAESTATPTEPVVEPSVTTGGKKLSKKGGRKSKKTRKMSGPAKEWSNLVSQVFKDGKAKNPNYKFKQALKDASKLKKKNNKTAKK
jgi:hypothetical protein